MNVSGPIPTSTSLGIHKLCIHWVEAYGVSRSYHLAASKKNYLVHQKPMFGAGCWPSRHWTSLEHLVWKYQVTWSRRRSSPAKRNHDKECMNQTMYHPVISCVCSSTFIWSYIGLVCFKMFWDHFSSTTSPFLSLQIPTPDLCVFAEKMLPAFSSAPLLARGLPKIASCSDPPRPPQRTAAEFWSFGYFCFMNLWISLNSYGYIMCIWHLYDWIICYSYSCMI